MWVTFILSTQVHKGGKGPRWSEVKSMIDLVLVKKDMLHYAQYVRAVRGMRQRLSDHVLLYKSVWWGMD